MTEIWKPVHGWPLYEASSLGRVRRVGNRSSLSPFPCRRYPTVHFCVGGVRRTMGVHQAVALAFIGPCPAGKEVGHKDHNPSNNRPGNLEYLTRLENVRQTIDAGRSNRGERHGHAKLTRRAVLEIRRLREAGVRLQDIGMAFGVSFQTVSRVARRDLWGWL